MNKTNLLARIMHRYLLKAVFGFMAVCSMLLSQPVSAGDITVLRISPLPYEGRAASIINLDGNWAFSPAPQASFPQTPAMANWKSIAVPGEWVMQGFKVDKGKSAGYERHFSVPASWQDKRIKLRFDAVYSECTVYVNGQEAGSHFGGFTRFEIDITKLVKTGADNRLSLAVKSEGLANSTSNASQYAYHALGGISRSVSLLALPEVNMAMLHVSTSFDSAYNNARMRVEATIANESAAAVKDCRFEAQLLDANGKTVALHDAGKTVAAMAAGMTASVDMQIDVKTPHHWDCEHPYLYTLVARLVRDGKTVATSSRRVGFRQIEVRGNQVFVNGSPIKLRGVCRHEVMPLRGRSLEGDMWRRDVELFRNCNVNYIRTSHYPPAEALLDACDSIGMLVEVEAPFCWAHQTKVEPKDEDKLITQHVEMVNTFRSHPSVLIWSIGNESVDFKQYFARAADIVKKIDPTRPRNFSQWGPDADGGVLEITNHHYPGPKGPDTYRNYKRPVVFDEYCHINAYNRYELAADPGLRSEWGPLFDRMVSNMYHSQGVLGGAIWVGIDDTFFLPNGDAVGYGTWGIIDGWRREKPEYFAVKKGYSTVRITLAGNIDSQRRVRLHIDNRHLFTNTKECRIEWTSGSAHGYINPDIKPRTEGDAVITLPANADPSQMEISVIGVRGYEIDHYALKLLPAVAQKIQPKKVRQQRMEYTETADAIIVKRSNCMWRVSKTDGSLGLTQNGDTILSNSPQLMLIPVNGEGGGIQMTGGSQTFDPFNPVCSDWVATTITYAKTDNGVDIYVEGTYDEACGAYTWHINADGTQTVDYRFTVQKDINPRQTGIMFTLPRSYSHLAWERKGFWNWYPDNNLAKLKGEADALNPSIKVCGLAGPMTEPANVWNDDQTANGSNIFRATKNNVVFATLSRQGTGMSVTVNSGGKQHVRTWIDKGVVRMLVADYTNGGSPAYFTDHVQQQYRPLHKGDVVKGTVDLTIK